uniref:ASD2 domain-containing protein n=1 Tax=Plectus sambesii TaxID=2011161 RepID=A0A914UZ52_9BILA
MAWVYHGPPWTPSDAHRVKMFVRHNAYHLWTHNGSSSSSLVDVVSPPFAPLGCRSVGALISIAQLRRGRSCGMHTQLASDGHVVAARNNPSLGLFWSRSLSKRAATDVPPPGCVAVSGRRWFKRSASYTTLTGTGMNDRFAHSAPSYRRLKCTKPPHRVGDGLQRSRSSVVFDTCRRDLAVGRKLLPTRTTVDDLDMTTVINRDFCPPSQLRSSSSGLAFRQAKQPQWRPAGRPNIGRLTDDNQPSNMSVGTMEQSLYDNVPSTSDSDVIADGANEPNQSANDAHLSKGSDNQPKRRNNSFSSLFGHQSSSDQRSESWVWSEQERITQTRPGQPRKRNEDFGEDAQARWFGSAERHLAVLETTSVSDDHRGSTASTPAVDDSSSTLSDDRSAFTFVEGMMPHQPKMPYADYDNETMRSAAARNREASKKYYMHLRQAISPNADSGQPRRTLIKSPSSLSAGGASTSSGGSGNGAGRGEGAVYLTPPTLVQEGQRVHRSLSDDDFMRSSSDQHSWAASAMEATKERAYQNHQAASASASGRDSPLHRAPSSAAASRGALKKINSKRLKAREEEQRQQLVLQRSLPELPAAVAADEQATIPRLIQNDFLTSEEEQAERGGGKRKNDALLLQLLPTPSDLERPRTCNAAFFAAVRPAAAADRHHYVCRTRRYLRNSYNASPIYATPAKHVKSASVDTDCPVNMKSPPPLPRKPPPPLDKLDCAPSVRYGSSPSLFDSTRLTAAPTSGGYFPAPSNGCDHRQESNRCQPPASSSMTSTIGGKPTVQVHPMPFSQPPPNVPPRSSKDDLKVATSGDAAHSTNNNNRGNPSPRPPVPRKPERLMLSPPRPTEAKTDGKATTDERDGFSTNVQQLSNFFGRMTVASAPSPPPRPSVSQRQHEKDRWSSSVSDSSKSTVDSEPSGSMSPPNARFLADLYGPSSSTSLLNLHASFLTDEDDLSPDDLDDLERKRQDLIASLSRKVAVLDEERAAVIEELEGNERIGRSVMETFASAGAPNAHQAKLVLHMEETGKVTSLLLKLSAQLSRVDNALQLLPPDATRKEKQLLLERRARLTSQYDDAKTLRASLDRRGETVLQNLAQVVSDQHIKEYQYFLQMKTKLLIDAKEIEEKLQLGQEQLLALERSASCASSTIES